MKKSFKIISALILSSTMAFGLSATIFATSKNVSKTEALYTPSTHYEVSDTASELASYYSSISSSDSGTTLLGKLQNLNSSKRKKTMGYSSMGTSNSSSPYIYTDYVLGSTTKDSNGQVYGSTIASFYTKTPSTSWNREHMWPNSRGGSAVEGDILHTRPTISSENSSRGNSFYVEGMNHNSNGWDPYTAGYEEWVRGECARTILYCVVANSGFSLSDASAISSGQTGYTSTMGDMDTLIKWHFKYTPNQYEMNRNNGAEYLQGNRNPFVDHPEYVAKIWSNFNSNVSSLCTSNASVYNNWTVGSCSTYGTNDASGGGTSTDPAISISASATSVKVGNSITLSATKTNLTGTVQWYVSDSSSNVVSLSATSGDSITVTGVNEGTETIYAHVGTVSSSVEITVKPATTTGTTSTATFDFSSSGNCQATSGSAEGVSFTTAQGSAQNAPAYNSNSGELRMYYGTNGNGNTFTLTPDEDYAITGVTITASSSSYTPTIKYNIDGGSDNSGTWSSTTMTISDIEASSSFVFRNANTSNTQLRIKSVAVTLVATGGSSTTPTISLNKTSASIAVNGTTNLTATVANGTGNVTWSTSSSSIAQLSATTGTSVTVTGKAAGTATITASYSGKTATCTVTVTAAATPTVNSVTVSPSTLSLNLTNNTTGSLTATVSVSGGAAQTVTWSTSNASVATVSNGTVTAKAVGTATITATSTADSTKKDTCTVTVSSGSTTTESEYQKVTTASDLTSGQYLIVYEEGSVAFNGGLSNLDAVNNTISVTISNSKIAKTSTTEAAEFTVDMSAGTILSASNKYIGNEADSNALTSSSTALTNTITLSDGDIDVASSGGAHLRYNSDASQARFRYYKSASYTNQKAIQFYKLSGSVSAKTLSSITLGDTQTSYTTGDTFVKPTVTATFSDNSTVDVTNSASFSGYDMSVAGTQTVTVSYTYGSVTKEATYTITVAQGSTPVTTYEQVTGSLTAGDKVVIVAQANRNSTSGYAMKSTIINQYYFDKEDASISNQKLNYTSNMAVWTVGGSASTGFTFYNEAEAKYFYGYTTTSGTKTFRDLGLTEDTTETGINWTVTANAAGTGYDVTTTHNSNTLYLEYYTSKSNFSAYTASATDIVINFYKATTVTTNPALEYAQNFLSAFTCDATGTNTPTFASGKSWASLKTAFQALTTPHQNTLKNATANESGTDIEKAVARYDYVVAKYGYENFMNRTITNSANKMNVFNGNSTNNILLILGSISLLGGLTYLAYFLKKRKED